MNALQPGSPRKPASLSYPQIKTQVPLVLQGFLRRGGAGSTACCQPENNSPLGGPAYLAPALLRWPLLGYGCDRWLIESGLAMIALQRITTDRESTQGQRGVRQPSFKLRPGEEGNA